MTSHSVGALLPRYELKRHTKITNMYSKSPASLWSDASVSSGFRSVYRYTYGMFIPSASEGKAIDAPIHLGAVFADLQPYPNLGAWHGSECKSFIPCRSSRCFGFLMTDSLRQPTLTYQPCNSVNPLWDIQQIDSHCRRSRAVAEPPDRIRDLCQRSDELPGAQLARL